MSRMEWQRQRAEDDAVRQMMRTHVLEARAQIDTVEDTGSSCHRRHVQPARVCSYTDFMKCQPLNFKGTEGVVGLSQWLEKMESVFHISGCAIDNQVKFATCTLLGVALTWWNGHNENKRKADDSSRNNHQQQPHKKQNVARAYTAGPGEKKVYTGDLPLCTKCNYHHTGQCAPKCGKCKRYGHTTTDCRVNTNNNNNKNQKAGACYECGNTGHIKKNCPKLKNHGNGTTQGRAYALGGRDASPDSNVITGTFLLNNRYAKILFDTGADRSFEYLSKGCDVFFAHITTKEAKDKSKGKRLDDVPIVRDFPKVFPKDLPGIPLAQQVEFQIDLVPGAAHVARAPYRLAPSKMKELAEQLQELSDKGFI
ncbi:putative reverse transcriptase domain-containing protein, partial [Tanacetum coccineum]